MKRRVRIVITAPIESWWGYDNMVADGMTEAQIIEVLQEDVTSLLEKAKWTIDDGKPAKKKGAKK